MSWLFSRALVEEYLEASQGDVCVSVFRRPDDGVAPEVDELYDRHLDGWRKECKVAHDTQGGKKIECLWLNYNPQLTLF